VFAGPGTGALACGCGQVLIEGRTPARFLTVGIQCGRCGAVTDAVLASQGRSNRNNPGLLPLSPGIALSGFDEALIQAVQAAMQAVSRRNRGLMAVAPIVLHIQSLPDPHVLWFGYGLFAVLNRRDRSHSIAGARDQAVIAAMRRSISASGTSSICVAMCQVWPNGSTSEPMRSP
jgi:hypothetical protein